MAEGRGRLDPVQEALLITDDPAKCALALLSVINQRKRTSRSRLDLTVAQASVGMSLDDEIIRADAAGDTDRASYLDKVANFLHGDPKESDVPGDFDYFAYFVALENSRPDVFL